MLGATLIRADLCVSEQVSGRPVDRPAAARRAAGHWGARVSGVVIDTVRPFQAERAVRPEVITPSIEAPPVFAACADIEKKVLLNRISAPIRVTMFRFATANSCCHEVLTILLRRISFSLYCSLPLQLFRWPQWSGWRNGRTCPRR